ncbi:phage tail sheath family protein [Chromobacterium haemolyticum]|uniref:phage tail sheath family protein n=1 Tax=Chromobacterium haemolyticum TaxID=394935 RepID=UPI002449116B|nr:phage tail sheath C-terminal domain-containing protein [Chromobacterium haemolyticum]MDH0342419.1 hypothetical protein [Chromobacterium haemolyticum]
MSDMMTVPGVYIQEPTGLSLSIQSGETAVPVFLGHFKIKGDAGEGCIRVESWFEFQSIVSEPDPVVIGLNADGSWHEDASNHAGHDLGYFSVRFYFENGGGPCYILHVDETKEESLSSIPGKILLHPEITLLCWCEFTKKDADVYSQLGLLLSAENNKGIFLLADGLYGKENALLLPALANKTQFAAYFPWLKTSYEHSVFVDVDGIGVEKIKQAVKGALPDEKKLPVGDLNRFFDVLIKMSNKNAAGLQQQMDGEKDKKSQKWSVLDADYKKALLDANNLGAAFEKYSQCCARGVVLRPSVAMAGIYARTDRERGVWKAPANVPLSGVQGLIAPSFADGDTLAKVSGALTWPVVTVDDALNMTLAKSQINAIRSFKGRGVYAWGARTHTEDTDLNWRFVPVRRLFNTVERDARAALRVALFEPNSQATWEVVRGALANYLHNLWQLGALVGDRPEQAYFVHVGLGLTMTEADVKDGRMIIRVGMAAVRPAEFIVLQLTQDVMPS